MNIYTLAIRLREDVVGVRAFTKREDALRACETFLNIIGREAVKHVEVKGLETWTAKSYLGSPWEVQLRETKLEGA